MNQFGHTRTQIHRDHAFIAPDGHVTAPLPGWSDTDAVTLISPHMGARFTMHHITMQAGATAARHLPGAERFLYLLDGRATVTSNGREHLLEPGGYVYCPPDIAYDLTTDDAATAILFERNYIRLGKTSPPPLIIGHESEQQSAPFMGDENAQLKPLLPDERAFDMAVNLFTFQPGTPLPFTETHVMEHGLYMVQGGGVYRLGDHWYPIQAGDVLWMGAYCPQWFGALGRTPSTYLYYKDVNRNHLLGQ